MARPPSSPAASRGPAVPWGHPRAWALVGVVLVAWAWAAPRFSHNDLALLAWQSHFSQRQLNLYDAVAREVPAKLRTLTYPPLSYWTVGAWMGVGHRAFGYFNYPDVPDPSLDVDSLGAPPLGPGETVWLKLLLLLAQAALAALAASLFRPGDRGGAFAAFFAQPVLLFIALGMGQVDVLTALWTVGALASFHRWRGPGGAALGFACLGLGALTKIYPVFLALGTLALWALIPSRRRWIPVGAAALGAVLALGLAPVWGPAFLSSCLSSDRADITFLVGHHDYVGPLKLYLAAAVLALAVLFPSRIQPLLGRLRTLGPSLDGGDRPTAALAVLYLCILCLVFFDRFWMPQYGAWISPWVYLASAWGGSLAASPPTLRSAWRRAPWVFNAVYLTAVPVLFHGNVDTNLYVGSLGVPTWGSRLLPWMPFLMFFASALFLALGFLSLRSLSDLGQKGALGPPRPLEPVPAWASFAGWVLFANIAVLLPALHRIFP